jgi:hypothetical protein
VGAAVVLGDDLDVLVPLAAIEHVFDAEIREVDLVAEVRELVFSGPSLNLARIAIGPPIAVGPAAIGLLEPLLIFTFEFLVEDDAANLGALLAEALRFAQVRAIQLRVMGQLAAPIHAGLEGLLAADAVIAAVPLQETVPAVGERHRSVAAVQRDGFHQALVAKMAQVGNARVGFRMMTLKIAFGHDTKRTDGRERPAIVAVQFVPVIAIEHDFAIEAARQFKAIDKRVTRIEGSGSVVPIAMAHVASVLCVAVIRCGRAVQFHPLHLDIACVIVTITVAWIEVHRLFGGELHRRLQRERRLSEPAERQATLNRVMSGGVRSQLFLSLRAVSNRIDGLSRWIRVYW